MTATTSMACQLASRQAKPLQRPLVHTFTSHEPHTEAQTRQMIDWGTAHHLGEEPGYFDCPLVLRESGRVIGRVGLNPFGGYRAGETVPEIEWTIGSAP